MKQVCLLTGKPGTGKTSLIKQAVATIEGSVGGFYTEDIRIGGVRKGFRLVTLDGQELVLSHVDIHGPCRISRYGVDVDGLDRVGVPALCEATKERDLVVIDEIGKMELLSARFREAVLQAIGSGKMVLGTIMLTSDPWADDIKNRPQVQLVNVTRANRRKIIEELSDWLKTLELYRRL